jgi:hypothetical protein
MAQQDAGLAAIEVLIIPTPWNQMFYGSQGFAMKRLSSQSKGCESAEKVIRSRKDRTNLKY